MADPEVRARRAAAGARASVLARQPEGTARRLIGRAHEVTPQTCAELIAALAAALVTAHRPASAERPVSDPSGTQLS